MPGGSALRPSCGASRQDSQGRGCRQRPGYITLGAEAAGTDRQTGTGVPQAPQGWENEPKLPTYTSVLPNVGREPNSTEQTWWGWQGVLFTPESPAAQTGPCDYMVHFVEEVPEWNRLGMGTGMNPTR